MISIVNQPEWLHAYRNTLFESVWSERACNAHNFQFSSSSIFRRFLPNPPATATHDNALKTNVCGPAPFARVTTLHFLRLPSERRNKATGGVTARRLVQRIGSKFVVHIRRFVVHRLALSPTVVSLNIIL